MVLSTSQGLSPPKSVNTAHRSQWDRRSLSTQAGAATVKLGLGFVPAMTAMRGCCRFRSAPLQDRGILPFNPLEARVMTATAVRSPALVSDERDRKGRSSSNRDRLAEIIFQRSFGRGIIKLASGRVSDFYFDMKPSMLHPEGASLIAEQILLRLKDADAHYVGGLEMGAVPITGAVCKYSYEQGYPVLGFFVRKEAKAHGAKKLIEGLAKNETLEGKRVVVVDDVTTTGESAMKAVQACRDVGADVVSVVSIVDRDEGARDFFAKHSLEFNALFSAREFLSR